MVVRAINIKIRGGELVVTDPPCAVTRAGYASLIVHQRSQIDRAQALQHEAADPNPSHSTRRAGGSQCDSASDGSDAAATGTRENTQRRHDR